MDTIIITFPEIKVKIPIKGLTFDLLENMLFEISQNIARKVFEKALTDFDVYLRNKREREKLKNTGKREKYFLARFIDILRLAYLYLSAYSREPRGRIKRKGHTQRTESH